MVVDQNHQSQIDTEPELLVMCIILVSLRCILSQGNLVVVLLQVNIRVLHYEKAVLQLCRKYVTWFWHSKFILRQSA